MNNTKHKNLLIFVVIILLIIFSKPALADPSTGFSYDGQTETTSPDIFSIGSVDAPYDGIGIEALKGSNVTLHENLKNIFTSGDENHGIYASESLITAAFPLSIVSKGQGAHGAISSFYFYLYQTEHVADKISAINFKDDVKISSEGFQASAVYVYNEIDADRETHVSNIKSSITLGDRGELNGKGEQTKAVYSYALVRAYFTNAQISNISNLIDIGADAKIMASGSSARGVDATVWALTDATNQENVTIELSNIKNLITLGDNAKITLEGDNGYGVYSRIYAEGDSPLSNIENSVKLANDAKITTNGRSAYGVYIYNKAAAYIQGEYAGELSDTSSRIDFGNGTNITASGEGSYGIYSYTAASAYLFSGTAPYNEAISISKIKNATIFGNDTVVKTSGLKAEGVSLYSNVNANMVTKTSDIENSITFGNNTTIMTDGEQAYGVYASTNIGNYVYIEGDDVMYRGVINIDEGNIEISKVNSKIVFGNNVAITTEKNSAFGIVTLTNLNINVASADDSINITKGNINVSDIESTVVVGDAVTITTKGDKAYGAYAMLNIIVNADSNIHINEGDINLSGIKSSISFGNRAKIITYGKEAHGAVFNNGTIFFGKSAEISVAGENSYAFYFKNVLEGYSPGFDSINAKSLQSNVIVNEAVRTLNITFTGTSKLYGNLKGDVMLNLKDTTTWEGGSDSENIGLLDIVMSPNVTWFMNKNSSVNSLNLGGGRLSFKINEDNFEHHRLTSGKLEGSGSIGMNIDMSNEPSGDFIEITGDAQGNYKLSLRHTGISDGEDIQLVNISGSSDAIFVLNGASSIIMGDYHYKLYGEEENTKWWLRVSGFDPGRSFTTATLGLMQFAKGIERVLLDEYRKTHNGLWILPFYNRQNFTKGVADGFYQDIWGIFIGADRENIPAAIEEYGKMYFGLFGGVGFAHQKFNNDGQGHIFSPSAGAYVTYNSYRGFYFTTYARYAAYDHKIEAYNTKGTLFEGESFTHGINASMEIGKTFELAGGMYVEPKAKLSWTGINDYEYNVIDVDSKVSEGGGFQLRLASRIGHNFKDSEQSTHNYYLDLGYAHSAGKGGIIEVDGTVIDLTIGKNRFEIGMGASYTDLSANKWFIDINYSIGDGMNDIRMVLGGSWPF